MNSDERRAARRKRREEKRARKKRERCKNSTLDSVADLNALYKAQREAARGVAWKIEHATLSNPLASQHPQSQERPT